VARPIRFAILDDAIDQPALFHLTSGSEQVNGEDVVEIHPAYTRDEVRPHLVDLLREGHVEVWLFREPESPALPLDEALSVVADDSNWNSETAEIWYGVVTTTSGDNEHLVEKEAHDRGT